MDFAGIIGMSAALLTTLCMLPQAIKSYRTKQTRDISWGYLSILFSALLLWVIYGLMIGSLPIMLGNAVSGALTLFLIVMKWRHG